MNIANLEERKDLSQLEIGLRVLLHEVTKLLIDGLWICAGFQKNIGVAVTDNKVDRQVLPEQRSRGIVLHIEHILVWNQHVEIDVRVLREILHNRCYPEFMLTSKQQRLAYGIFITEVFRGHLLVDDNGKLFVQCFIERTADQLERHH